MARGKKKRKVQDSAVARFLRPTEAREAHNDFRSAGAAVRVIPPIETLYNAGKLTAAEFLALDYYREQANKAEDDVAEEGTLSPAKIMGGGCGGVAGSRIPAKLLCTPAILETARLERDLGSLLEIAQFIVRDDKSLSAWCIQQHGGRERYKVNAKGEEEFVAMVPVAEKRVLAMALLELRMAARRLYR